MIQHEATDRYDSASDYRNVQRLSRNILDGKNRAPYGLLNLERGPSHLHESVAKDVSLLTHPMWGCLVHISPSLLREVAGPSDFA